MLHEFDTCDRGYCQPKAFSFFVNTQVFGVHNLLPYVKENRITRLLLVPTLLKTLLSTCQAAQTGVGAEANRM